MRPKIICSPIPSLAHPRCGAGRRGLLEPEGAELINRTHCDARRHEIQAGLLLWG